MIVRNKCVEKATGSIIVLILTDERECCVGGKVGRSSDCKGYTRAGPAGGAEQSNKSLHCKFIRAD